MRTTKIKKEKPVKRGRQKTVYTCNVCGIIGNNEIDPDKKIIVTPGIPCGYCKQAFGRTTIHTLCDKCFLRGCPIASRILRDH